HEIDRTRHVLKRAVHRLAEDLRHLRIVDRNRDHLVADALEVARYVERRRGGVRLRFDADHGDALRTTEDVEDLVAFVQYSARFSHTRSEEHTSELQSRENLVC